MFLLATSALYIINHAPGSYASENLHFCWYIPMNDSRMSEPLSAPQIQNATWIRSCLVAVMLFSPPPRAQISKNNAGDIVMVISQNGGKNAWVINATLHPCVCTTVSQYWREQFLFIFFLLFHSRPFLYKWYRRSERQFQVFKSEHTQQFTSLPRIFTLINWGCYYGIKIDEVNLSESYGTFALNEEVHSRSALGMFHVQHHH